MSSTLPIRRQRSSTAHERPETWDELYLPTVRALIEAGEHVLDELRKISGRQGLASKPMAVAVWHLYHNERMTAGELARQCACDAGNLSSLLDRLEEAGLVERAACDSDRRIRFVRLTTKGRKLAAQVERDYKASAIYSILKSLGGRERRNFTSVLESIASASDR